MQKSNTDLTNADPKPKAISGGDTFQSFLMGGFECSTHRRGDEKRIDVIAATRHDEFALPDYQRLLDLEMRVARDGIRWHLIEKAPYQYDFSSAISQIRAARETGLQVIWDLFHYGFPDDLDLMSAGFVKRFAAFAGEFTKLLLAEKIEQPYLCLVNEISFFAWAVGEVSWWFPHFRHRGDEVKRQLLKAAIAAAETVRKIAPHAVLIQTDPIVNIVPRGDKIENISFAKGYHDAQFHALDMLLGKREPELGGNRDLLDVIGVNFYNTNQWRHPGGRRIHRGNRDYKPFNELLQEFYAHFEIPLFVAETGIENEARPEWFRYVCDQVRIAIGKGVPVLGICLYPIVNHPGWDDNRHCYNGLWDYPNDSGEREIYEPLAEEIKRQTNLAKKAANE